MKTSIIILSILFLMLILQVFCINQSYNRKLFNLRNENEILAYENDSFKNTIVKLNDSIFFNYINPKRPKEFSYFEANFKLKKIKQYIKKNKEKGLLFYIQNTLE